MERPCATPRWKTTFPSTVCGLALSKIANCHGNGLCWTDRVEITPATAVNTKTTLENAMTRVVGRKKPLTRLACQVEVLEDCEVRTRCKDRR